MFWSEIGSGFGELGGTPLPIIPRSTPQGGGGGRGWKKKWKKEVGAALFSHTFSRSSFALPDIPAMQTKKGIHTLFINLQAKYPIAPI